MNTGMLIAAVLLASCGQLGASKGEKNDPDAIYLPLQAQTVVAEVGTEVHFQKSFPIGSGYMRAVPQDSEISVDRYGYMIKSHIAQHVTTELGDYDSSGHRVGTVAVEVDFQ